MAQYDFKFKFDGDEYIAEYIGSSKDEGDPTFNSYNLAFTRCEGYEDNEPELVVTIATKMRCRIGTISYEGYKLYNITIEHGTNGALGELTSWLVNTETSKMGTRYRTYLFPDKIMCNQNAREQFSKAILATSKIRKSADRSLSRNEEVYYTNREIVWASRSCFEMANASMRIDAERVSIDQIDNMLKYTSRDLYDVTLMKAEIAAELVKMGMGEYANTTSYMEIYS